MSLHKNILYFKKKAIIILEDISCNFPDNTTIIRKTVDENTWFSYNLSYFNYLTLSLTYYTDTSINLYLIENRNTHQNGEKLDDNDDGSYQLVYTKDWSDESIIITKNKINEFLSENT